MTPQNPKQTIMKDFLPMVYKLSLFQAQLALCLVESGYTPREAVEIVTMYESPGTKGKHT